MLEAENWKIALDHYGGIGFASKVRIHCWTQSVPPRGSGWVRK